VSKKCPSRIFRIVEIPRFTLEPAVGFEPTTC
jgi:hypothetical protein